jgi:hypothetical protein
MPAKLYMDVHVPRPVTDQLRRRGVDVMTANDDGNGNLQDEELLSRATELGRVMVSQDIRFCDLAGNWQHRGRFFAGFAFAHPFSITIGQFVSDLELIAIASLEGECENQIFRLPL